MVCAASYNDIKGHKTMQTCKKDEGYNSAAVLRVVFSSSSNSCMTAETGCVLPCNFKFLAWLFFFFPSFSHNDCSVSYCQLINKWVYSSPSSSPCNRLATDRKKPWGYCQISTVLFTVCINSAASLTSPTRPRTSFCNCLPTVLIVPWVRFLDWKNLCSLAKPVWKKKHMGRGLLQVCLHVGERLYYMLLRWSLQRRLSARH